MVGSPAHVRPCMMLSSPLQPEHAPLQLFAAVGTRIGTALRLSYLEVYQARLTCGLRTHAVKWNAAEPALSSQACADRFGADVQGRCFDLLRDAAPLADSAAWDPRAGGPPLCAPVVTSEEEALELLFEVCYQSQVTSKHAVHHAYHVSCIAPPNHTWRWRHLPALQNCNRRQPSKCTGSLPGGAPEQVPDAVIHQDATAAVQPCDTCL